jgi:antitoxin (DNA-binding transcriptional repressor) of toxin-antitoxin stability system
MSIHSVADANDRLPELIDRALKGESIVITRDGQPIAELKPIFKPAGKVSAAALDWLAARRVGAKLTHEDAGASVSRMRDEDERQAYPGASVLVARNLPWQISRAPPHSCDRSVCPCERPMPSMLRSRSGSKPCCSRSTIRWPPALARSGWTCSTDSRV